MDVGQKPSAPPPTAADAEAEKKMREMFKKISGVDLEVDAYELQDILNASFMKGTTNNQAARNYMGTGRIAKVLTII